MNNQQIDWIIESKPAVIFCEICDMPSSIIEVIDNVCVECIDLMEALS